MKLLKSSLTPPLLAINAIVLAAVSVYADPCDAYAYVTSGLVAQWDGIDNAGTGSHDATATTWVDLSGNGYDAVRKDGAALAWADGNSMKRTGTSGNTVVMVTDMTMDFDSSFTFDFCGVQPTKAQAYFFHFVPTTAGKSQTSFYVNAGWQARVSAADKGCNSGNDLYTGGSLITIRDGVTTAHYNVPQGTSFVKNDVGVGNQGEVTGTLYLASLSNGSSSFLGNFYALRIYNRALTDGERLWNTAVDQVRFGGMPANEAKVVVPNLKTEYGLTGVPALGSATTIAFTGGCDFSLLGLSEHPDDGALSREYATDCRARFRGWSFANGSFSTRTAGAETNCTIAVTNSAVMLEWDVRNELKLLVSARTGGKVCVAGGAASTSDLFWAEEGVPVVVEAVPDAGYEFVSWTGDVVGLGSVTSAVTTCRIGVPSTISALFKETSHIPVTLNWKPGVRSGNFNDPDCWTEGVVPGTGDTLYITNYENGKVTITVDAPTPRLAKLVISNPRNLASCPAVLSARNWTTCIAADAIEVGAYGRIVSDLPFGPDEMSNRVWLAGNTLTVAANGSISADNGGYKCCDGPCWVDSGRPFTSVYTSGGVYGAPYGGSLSYSYSTWQHPYGSDEWPVDPGSGAGDWRNGAIHTSQCPGGGAVFLDFTGAVTVNGTVSADATIGNYCPGSGGSVLVCCRTLSGSGSISAIASKTAVTGSTNCGGSGRIAVHYNPSAQSNTVCTVSFNAIGGIGSNLGYKDVGVINTEDDDIGDYEEGIRVHLPGTIWFSDNQFLLHSEAYRTAGYPFKGTWKSGEPLNGIHWTGDRTLNGTRLYFDRANFPFTIDGNLTLTGSGNYGRMIFGLIFTNSQVTVNGNLTLTDSRMQLTGGKLTVAGNVETGYGAAQKFAGGEIALFAMPTNAPGQFGVEAEIGGTLHLSNYSVLAPFCEPHNGAVARVSAKNVTVDAGGKIDADTKGYDSTYGPGAYRAGGTSSYGGAYGGQGGLGNNKGVEANRTQPYGDPQHPVYPGSGSSYSLGFNARGGGLVYMDVAKRFLLNGLITADGNRYNVGYYGWQSGSSGGGVYIRARHFSGSGTIRARGGFPSASATTGDAYPAAGGGGRVAIWSHDALQLADFVANQIDVSPGHFANNVNKVFVEDVSATGDAGAGTIYLGFMSSTRIIVK